MTRHSNSAWAAAYANGDLFCIHTISGQMLKFKDPKGGEHILRPGASDGDLGTAVVDCLAHSRLIETRDEVFDPDRVQARYRDWIGRLMKAGGYRTKRALLRNMNCCDVTRESGVIEIRPTLHKSLEAWSGEGIQPEDHVLIPADSPPERIGSALRTGFGACIR